MINLDRNSKGQFVKGKNIRDKTGKKYGRLTVRSLSKNDLEEKRIGIVYVNVVIR